MTPVEKQIAALEEKIARERAKLADAKVKAAAQHRKRDTRRKILFGYAFLDWLTTLPSNERKRIASLVHGRLKPRERETFPLREVLQDLAEAAAARATPPEDRAPDTGSLPFTAKGP